MNNQEQKEQIFTDPMPLDLMGEIEWVPEAQRVDRCGNRTAQWIKDRCCRRLFNFRACRIAGGIVRATVCNQCSLEYDIVLSHGNHGTSRAYKIRELARFRKCDEAEALAGAMARWGDLLPKPKPQKQPQGNMREDFTQEQPEDQAPTKKRKPRKDLE